MFIASRTRVGTQHQQQEQKQNDASAPHNENGPQKSSIMTRSALGDKSNNFDKSGVQQIVKKTGTTVYPTAAPRVRLTSRAASGSSKPKSSSLAASSVLVQVQRDDIEHESTIDAKIPVKHSSKTVVGLPTPIEEAENEEQNVIAKEEAIATKQNLSQDAIEIKSDHTKGDVVKIAEATTVEEKVSAPNTAAAAAAATVIATAAAVQPEFDEQDENDPLMVAEYAADIYTYMKDLEVKTQPNPQYMAGQKELKWRMRTILIDWLAEVHSKYRFIPETLFLTVNLMDRFLSVRQVSMAKLQLVGITAMLIACKYEEMHPPAVADFVFISDGGYEAEEILKAERYMLGMLNFNISYPSPLNFLRRINKADNYDTQVRTLAKYFMEVTMLDERFLECVPSLMTAMCTWLSRVLLLRGPWTPTLEAYSGYKETELKPLAQMLLDFINSKPKMAAIFKKYSHARCLRASLYVKAWLEKGNSL